MNYSKSLITLTCTFVLLTQTSCLKKQNLEESNLGPAISADEVEQKMAEGIGNLDPNDVRKNESSSLTAFTTYEDSQTLKIFSQSLIVNTITSSTTKTTINLDYSKTDYLNSNMSFNNLAYPLEFNYENNVSELRTGLTVKSADKVPFFLYRAFIVMAVFACREEKVTCHNLSIEDNQMALSPEVADPRICSDTLHCKIPVRTVEYDLVDYKEVQSDGKPARSHFRFMMSSALPFFSKVLQYCVRGLVDMEDRKVLAEDCVTVNGFSVGD